MDKETIRIGFVQRSHGVQGALKVQPLTDDSSRFEGLKSVIVEHRRAHAAYGVGSVNVRQDTVYIMLEGVDQRESADRLRGAYLCVPREQAVTLPEGTYFICDLIGCGVADTDGREWGILTDVLQTGANDVYVVKGRSELLVPALKRVLKSVDVAQKRILLDARVLREVAIVDDAL